MSGGIDQTNEPSQVDLGLDALRDTFFRFGGSAETDLRRLVAPGREAELEEVIAVMKEAAGKLGDLVETDGGFAGSHENVGRLSRAFQPYIRALIDDPGNHKVLTACTGAAATVADILKSPSGASRVFLNAEFPYHYGEADRFMRGSGFEDGAVTERAALALVASAYYNAQESLFMHPRNGVDETPNIIAASATAAIATGRERRGSDHLWGAVRTLEGTGTYHIEFDKGMGQNDREWQDALCNVIVTNSILAAAGLPQMPILDERVHSDVLVDNPDGPGRIIELTPKAFDPAKLEGPGPFLIYRDGSMATQAEIDEIMQRPLVVFPGSFDLVHFGHEQVAHAAHLKTGRDVFFEICADNANPEKPEPLSNEELARRVTQNLGRHPTFITRGVPLFTDKAELFPNSDFVAGFDIAQRIADPAFYEGGETARDAALEAMQSRRTHIHVLGRKDDDSSRFKTAHDVVAPAKFADLFHTLVGEAHISSSVLRNLRGRLREQRED